jgi:hypothetical protein
MRGQKASSVCGGKLQTPTESKGLQRVAKGCKGLDVSPVPRRPEHWPEAFSPSSEFAARNVRISPSGRRKRCAAVLFPLVNRGYANWKLSVLNTITRLMFATAAIAAGLYFNASPSRAAAGAEPWCIVTDEGNTRCNYGSSQECLRAIASGERGFCNVNSSGPPSPATAAQPQHRKRRSQ